MSNEAILADLLSVWMRQRVHGQPQSLEQLCADHPLLLPHLQRRVQALQQVEAALSGSPVAPGPQAILSLESRDGDGKIIPPPPASHTLPTQATANLSGMQSLSPGAASTPAAGRPILPGYEIERELGRGGMGVVYQALDTRLKRRVALKMILAGGHAGQADLARFKTEAEAVARLQHPGIVQIYEVGVHDGLPYFCLEFCPGGSLDRKLDGTPLPPRDASALVEKLALAMQAAHNKGVIHRDLKPANVLLGEDGMPKITDFGLAKKLDEAGQTNTGSVMGTPSYMAPEQAQGSKDIAPACDVYALGAILYELLTGRPPFKSATVLETLRQVVNDDPVPPTQLQSKTPKDLEIICLKCLHKDPHKRYSNAQALADDLRRFRRREPIAARPVGRMERSWRWCHRNPVVAGLTAAVALVMLLGVAISAHFALAAERRAQGESLAKLLAEKRAEDEAAARTVADQQLRRAERLVYAGKLALAQQAFQEGNGVQALQHLDSGFPEFGSTCAGM
jgi:hypothetical protein